MRGFKGSPEWAKYKNRKRLARKGLVYSPNPEFGRLIKDRNKTYLVAPKNFSLTNNTNAVIEYFHSVHQNAKGEIYTVMDMSAITETDLATISWLMSVMMDKRRSGRLFKKYITVYTPPNNTAPGILFRKAQLRETVTGKGIADHAFSLSRLDTKINKDYINDVLSFAEKFLKKENPGKISPLLVEIASNTNNHANPRALEEEDKLPWFLTVVEDKKSGKIIFSVVDLGIGIFESLKIKGLTKNDNFEDSIKDLYQNSQSKFLRTNIPTGVDSSTGLFYRGQGMETIYDCSRMSYYDKFIIVTNRGVVDLKNIEDERVDSGVSLDGTIYYWEMSSNG